MHCKLDIEKALIKKAINSVQTKTIKRTAANTLMIEDKDYPAEGQAYRVATRVAEELNTRFGDNIASVTSVTYGQEIKIKPSNTLIDDYYDGYVKQWNRQQQNESGIDQFGDSSVSYNEMDKDNPLIDKELRAKYFEGETTSTEVLAKIIASKHPLRVLARRLARYAKVNDVKIILDPVRSYNNNGIVANGYYDPKTNTIHIAEFANFKGGQAESVVLHEILHSLTKSKLQDKNSQVVKDFNKLYEAAKNALGDQYALLDSDEFLVALFTNSDFIKQLKEVPAVDSKKYPNLFQEIFDFFLNLFDIKKDSTLYEQAFAIATNILDEVEEQYGTFNEVSKQSISYSQVPGSHFHTNPYAREQQFFKDKIFKLTKKVKEAEENSPEYKAALIDLKFYEARTDKAIEEGDIELYKELGEEALADIQEMLNTASEDNKDIDIIHALAVVEAWREFPGLETEAAKLNRILFNMSSKLTLEHVNEVNTRPKAVVAEQIDLQNRDINSPESWWGSLANSENILASTIGALIGKAHNRISTKNKEANKTIKEAVKDLADYSKKNGVSVDKMYDIFIQVDRSGSSALTSKFLPDGTENPNWIKIQETPELKAFYDFYQSNMKKLLKQVPSFNGANEFFIPNIKDRDWKDKLKALDPRKTRSTSYSKEENVRADVIQMEMHKNIPANVKTKNLGEALSFYTAHVNEFHEMNEILPKVRLLQQSIAYVMDPKSGKMVDRQYIQPSNPSKPIAGNTTKLYKMVDTIINMQVKGEMRKDQWKPRYGEALTDAEGNDVGEKYLDISGFIDNALSYNSILRIGLNPINAIANVSFGDVSNLVEAIGGKYFTVRGLHQASKIFLQQVMNKDSVLHQLHARLNVLQEMDDYNDVEEIKSAGEVKKISPEKLKEIAFAPQKMGENWIQSRTMLAMLIKEGYLTSKGELTSKYKELTEDQIDQLANKVIGVAQQLHGRYSSKEAAAAQQNIMYRMMIQFRKWIPAAIENRVGAYNPHNNRLGTATEGRYLTYRKLFGPRGINLMISSLTNDIERAKKGGLSAIDVYNMRKNMAEIAVWTILAIAFAGLHGGDDDKERRKQAMVKSLLTIMTRTSGDISFWYNPTSFTKLAQNAMPIAKTGDDLIKTILYLPTLFELGDNWEVTRGRNKGKSKFRAQLPKILVGVNPFDQAMGVISEDEFKTY